MITVPDLRRIGRGRMRDAEVLHRARRYDGAMYLCGYAVELGLKARACRTLKWVHFPSSSREFQGIESFKTHNLQVLLHLSGVEDRVKVRAFAEWSVVLTWNPETRYRVPGRVTRQQSLDMITASKRVLKAL